DPAADRARRRARAPVQGRDGGGQPGPELRGDDLSLEGLAGAHRRGRGARASVPQEAPARLRRREETLMAQPTLPPWIQTLQQRAPECVSSYMARRDRILRDGAIPAKYKLLMTMIVDALLSPPDGVANIANRARAAGASEAEVQEAVEVAYLFGGTPALVTAVNALKGS